MSPKKPYHHRNLPVALRAAAADLVGERGPSGFSLREVARRADVSHAAPAHHFGDTRGLLTSLAAEGFERLTEALSESRDEPDATVRLRACGKAYVRTALAYPGHFAVVFRDDLLDGDDPALVEWGSAAYAALVDAVEAVREQVNPDLDVDTAATMCWVTMQGLVTLAPALEQRADEQARQDLDVTIDDLLTLLLDGIRPR